MKKKITPKDSRLLKKSPYQTVLEILGIPSFENFKKSKKKLEQRLVHSFRSAVVKKFKDTWFNPPPSVIAQAISKAVRKDRTYDKFLEIVASASQSVPRPPTFIGERFRVVEVLRKFEKSLGGVLWHAVIKKDEKAVTVLLDSKDIKEVIKNLVNRVNRVMRLDKDNRLSEKDGLSLAYEAIKEAQHWYSDPRNAERYDEEKVTFRDLVQRLPELFKRAFFYRLMEKIRKEVEDQPEKILTSIPYEHPETGEHFLFLKQAALLLGLTERQLRYRISKGKIPANCYCRFNQLEGRDYYHQLKRKKVSAFMIPEKRLDRIRNILKRSETLRLSIDKKTFIPIGEAARRLATKRGILIPSANKCLKRNKEHFGGRLHDGMWWFPKKRFKK